MLDLQELKLFVALAGGALDKWCQKQDGKCQEMSISLRRKKTLAIALMRDLQTGCYAPGYTRNN